MARAEYSTVQFMVGRINICNYAKQMHIQQEKCMLENAIVAAKYFCIQF